MRYAFIALMLLSGCADIESYRTDSLISQFSGSCEKLGFTKGTPEFGNCIIAMSKPR